MSKKFEVTSSYPYAKVWISNQGKGDIQFTITRGSDTGTLVSGSDVTIRLERQQVYIVRIRGLRMLTMLTSLVALQI